MILGLTHRHMGIIITGCLSSNNMGGSLLRENPGNDIGDMDHNWGVSTVKLKYFKSLSDALLLTAEECSYKGDYPQYGNLLQWKP